MIDLESETVFPLARAARMVPGGPVDVSTLHRWRLSTTGPRLECVRTARGWCTSLEALRRHIHARSLAAMGQTPEPVVAMTATRRASHRRAERELAEAGI